MNTTPLIIYLSNAASEALPSLPLPCSQPDICQITFHTEHTIAHTIYLSGKISPPALCSGSGLCGQCRVRFLSPAPEATPEDLLFFTSADIAAGWRLGCHHHASADTLLALPPEIERTSLVSPHTDKTSAIDIAWTKQSAVIAFDIGTTSVHWQVSNMAGAILQQGSMLNPQIGAGSDIMARIQTALTVDGMTTLQSLLIDALQNIVETSKKDTDITAICLAGNPAMTAIALGKSVVHLATAPYELEYTGDTWEHIAALPPTWIPPQISPFVGGDIACGLATCLSMQPHYPFLLADMGTNGEFLLALSPTHSLNASVALGPALEGIGLRCATNAKAHAITHFSFTPQGLHGHFMTTDADELAQSVVCHGISGTGYLSLIHILRTLNLIDTSGHLAPQNNPRMYRLITENAANLPANPHNARHAPAPHNEPFLPLPYGLYLSASDIEEILKVKAAFSLAYEKLIEAAQLPPQTPISVYLAGALGTHIEPTTLIALGFFPPHCASRFHILGNAALDGATHLLHSKSLQTHVSSIAATSHMVDLTKDAHFLDSFVRHMVFQ